VEQSYTESGDALTLVVERAAGRLSAGSGAGPVDIEAYEIDERFISVRIDGKVHRMLYALAGGRIHVCFRGRSFTFIPASDDDERTESSGGFTPEITSPMPGKVLDVLVSAGDEVEADAPLLLLEAMKMEQTIRAPARARVVEIRASPDAMVGPGEVLAVLEPLDGDEG